MWWLFVRQIRRPLRRFVVGAIGVAFPVAMLGSILLYVDSTLHSMTAVAVAPVQVEMRALADSLNVDMTAVGQQIAKVPGVHGVERFASADVIVSAPGTAPTPARLFAVDPAYLDHHPEASLVTGTFQGGTALTQPLRELPGFPTARTVTIALPVAAQAPPPPAAPAPASDEAGPVEAPPPPPWSITLPVTGTADLRQASTWFAVPSGDAQGDIALVPRSLVIDYATFERSVLPALRTVAGGDSSWAFNPGATSLPRASVETHVDIAHSAYPPDPGNAVVWSNRVRRVIEAQGAGSVVVTDNAGEALMAAQDDATNAKILFLLLGLPGVLVGAAIGVAAAGALAETQRREQALLQLRGATRRQLVVLTTAQAVVTSVVGAALGLVAAGAAVALVTGRTVWNQIPAGRLGVTAALAVGVGLLTTAVRLLPVVRGSRRAEVVEGRRRLEAGWNPLWRRARLDVVALGVGALLLAVNLLAGGLRQTPIEGQTLALAFYVLLAPVALWIGAVLLAVRGLLALLSRLTRPDRPRPLPNWPAAALRWLGRRPARTSVALILCALAIAFGTTVTAFTTTYETARAAERAASLGSDLRLTPAVDAPPPPPVPGVAAISPVREIPARVGTDRKTIGAIDVASYRQAVTSREQLLSGQGVATLAADRGGVLINKELADGFSVGPGDALPVTVFPDDPLRAKILPLRVVGVFRAVAPMDPVAELVMPADGIPGPLPAPDFYLVRVAPGAAPATVAATLRRQLPDATVTTPATLVVSEQRALTALNLRGLSRLESVAAGLVAAVGVAVLAAFMVLERRREAAVLRTVGAGTAQVVTAPVVEGAVAVLGGLVVGIPIGLGLGLLSIQILALFFTLPPPLLVVPTGAVAALAGIVLLTSAIALGSALTRIARQPAAAVLRDV